MPTTESTGSPILLHPVFVPEEVLAEWAGKQKEVLDLSEAAAFLRVPEEEVLGLVRDQGLPARQVGQGWRFLKAAIRAWLGSGTPVRPSRKEAQLALAGKYRDDPDLMRICKEAYEQRGRPLAEED
jgi:excisionase family DNA binding protein